MMVYCLRHQAMTYTDVDHSQMRFYGIQLSIEQKFKIPITTKIEIAHSNDVIPRGQSLTPTDAAMLNTIDFYGICIDARVPLALLHYFASCVLIKINVLKPRQHGHHFADDILKSIFYPNYTEFCSLITQHRFKWWLVVKRRKAIVSANSGLEY